MEGGGADRCMTPPYLSEGLAGLREVSVRVSLKAIQLKQPAAFLGKGNTSQAATPPRQNGPSQPQRGDGVPRGRGAGGVGQADWGATYLCQGLKGLLLLLAQPPALSCHLFSQRLQLLLQHLNPALQDPPGPPLLSCPSVPSGSHRTTP